MNRPKLLDPLALLAGLSVLFGGCTPAPKEMGLTVLSPPPPPPPPPPLVEQK